MELTLYSQLCFAVSILKKSLSKAGSELGQGPGPPLNIYQLVHRKSGVLHLFTEQMNPLHLILIFSPFQIPAIRLLYWRQQWRAPGSRGHWDGDTVLDVWHQVSSFTKYYSQCTHSWLLWRAYFWFVNPCFDGIGQLSYLCFICKLSGLLMSKQGRPRPCPNEYLEKIQFLPFTRHRKVWKHFPPSPFSIAQYVWQLASFAQSSVKRERRWQNI